MDKYDVMSCCNQFRLACTCAPGGKRLTRLQVWSAIEQAYDKGTVLNIKDILDELFDKD